jgi:hypothetical protein
MGLLDWKIFGVPENHEADKTSDKATVDAPEFDVTQYAKKLAVIVGVVFPAAIAVAKAANVDITPSIVVAGFVVTATSLLAVSIVMAVVVGARAYVTAHASKPAYDASAQASSTSETTPAPPGMKVWLIVHDDPFVVLAIGRAGDSISYLVAGGARSQRPVTGQAAGIQAYDAPTWTSKDEVTAVHIPDS